MFIVLCAATVVNLSSIFSIFFSLIGLFFARHLEVFYTFWGVESNDHVAFLHFNCHAVLARLTHIAKGFGLADFSDVISFALLIIILVVKPTGIFGEKTIDKV